MTNKELVDAALNLALKIRRYYEEEHYSRGASDLFYLIKRLEDLKSNLECDG